jgi:hypothetical protein
MSPDVVPTHWPSSVFNDLDSQPKASKKKEHKDSEIDQFIVQGLAG